MTCVVIDTSVLLRYLIRPSPAVRRLIEELWIGAHIQMVTAPELIGELKDVLARPRMRAYVSADDGQALLDAVSMLAVVLPPLGVAPAYTRDAKDDKFVACAVLGHAGHVITLDRNLLVLGAFGDIQMVTPGTFLDQHPPG